jgi:hypothetical protein
LTEETSEEKAKKERVVWVGKLEALRTAGAGPPDCRAYFRMLDFGVQIEAVLIKMRMDDADAEAIEIFAKALGEMVVSTPTSTNGAGAADVDGGGAGGSGAGAIQRRRSLINLRRIHWQGLDERKASKSVFKSGGDRKAADGSKNVSQDEVQLLEQLFLEKAAKKLVGGAGGAKGKAKKDTGPKVVKLLEVRRSNSVMIALALFKDLALDEAAEGARAVTSPSNKQSAAVGKDKAICEAVMQVKDEQLPPSKLQALVEITPTPLELTKLNRFKLRKGEKFGPVEQFFLALDRQVPRIRDKAESLLFRAQVEEQVESLEADIATMTMACTEMLQSAKLAGLLQTLLTVGNILNESSGVQVSGFALSSLPKLLLTKSPVDRKLTVVDFLVRILWPPPAGQAEHGWAQRERLLLFAKELPSLPLAWRLPHPRQQLQQLRKAVAALEVETNRQQQDEEKKQKIAHGEERAEEERRQAAAAKEAKRQEEEQCEMAKHDRLPKEVEERRLMALCDKPLVGDQDKTSEKAAENKRRVSGLGGLFGSGESGARAANEASAALVVQAPEEEVEEALEEQLGAKLAKKVAKAGVPALTGRAALFAAISARKKGDEEGAEEELETVAQIDSDEPPKTAAEAGQRAARQIMAQGGSASDAAMAAGEAASSWVLQTGQEDTKEPVGEEVEKGAEKAAEGRAEAENQVAEQIEGEIEGKLFMKRKGLIADSWPEVECRYTSSSGLFECESEGVASTKVLRVAKIENRGKHRILLREHRFDLTLEGRDEVVALAASSAAVLGDWFARLPEETETRGDAILAVGQDKIGRDNAQDSQQQENTPERATLPAGRNRFISATIFGAAPAMAEEEMKAATEVEAKEQDETEDKEQDKEQHNEGEEDKEERDKEQNKEGKEDKDGAEAKKAAPPLIGRAALFAAISKRGQSSGDGGEVGGKIGGEQGERLGHRRRVSLPASPGGRAGLLAGISATKGRPVSIADEAGAGGGRVGLLAAIAGSGGKPTRGTSGSAGGSSSGGRGNLLAAIAASAGTARTAPGLNRRRRKPSTSGERSGSYSPGRYTRDDYMVGFKPSMLLQQLHRCVEKSNGLLAQLNEQYDELERASGDALVYFGEEEEGKQVGQVSGNADNDESKAGQSETSNNEVISKSLVQLKLLHEASEIFSKSITAYDKVWRQQQRDLKRELPPAVAAAGEPVMTMIGSATMHIQRIADNVHVVSVYTVMVALPPSLTWLLCDFFLHTVLAGAVSVGRSGVSSC